MRYVLFLILISACQTSNQFREDFLGSSQDCMRSKSVTGIDTLIISSLDSKQLLGSYVIADAGEFSPFILDLTEESFILSEHKLNAWHDVSLPKVNNKGAWKYLGNSLILNRGNNKSNPTLLPLEFEGYIWLVPTCKEGLFAEYTFKITNGKEIDELVLSRELLYSSFLHKKI